MDLPPLPGDSSLAGILAGVGDGQAGPVAPFPRGPGPGGASQGEEVVVARRKGLEAGDVGTVVLVYPKGGTWWSSWTTRGTPWTSPRRR